MASKIKDDRCIFALQSSVPDFCCLQTCIHASIYNKYMHIQRQIQRYHITKEVIGHDKRIPTVAALVIALLTDLFVTSDLARARAVGINEVAGEDLALGALAFVGCLSLVGGDCLMFIVLTCSIILVLVPTAFVAVFPNTNVYSLMPLQFHILYMSFFCCCCRCCCCCCCSCFLATGARFVSGHPLCTASGCSAQRRTKHFLHGVWPSPQLGLVCRNTPPTWIPSSGTGHRCEVA